MYIVKYTPLNDLSDISMVCSLNKVRFMHFVYFKIMSGLFLNDMNE